MILVFFLFKQKTAYEMRISDWSSDVCSSDLFSSARAAVRAAFRPRAVRDRRRRIGPAIRAASATAGHRRPLYPAANRAEIGRASCRERVCQYVSISVVAGSLKQKIMTEHRDDDITRKSRSIEDTTKRY